jgi:hypothetical protein
MCGILPVRRREHTYFHAAIPIDDQHAVTAYGTHDVAR